MGKIPITEYSNANEVSLCFDQGLLVPIFLPMNSVGWAGLLLKTPPTDKSQRFWIGTSAQWDRASFVDGFKGKAFLRSLHDY